MWRIIYKGLTLHEVLIMAYMNTLEAVSSHRFRRSPEDVLVPSLPPQGQRSFTFKAAQSHAV
jgi:hypothetical protein